ncbi:MAG: AMP-binding protein [Deltaproteobacteria bacterium]|nr:AMP-binding protein [Deltaproteobacteria bacterium]
MAAKTVMEVLAQTVRRYPNKTALRYKEGGSWHDLTWKDYEQTVRRFARGMCALGLPDKGFVTILSANCKEWVFADIASIFAGTVPAGIYPTSSPDQCAYIIGHCGATCVVVEDVKQLEKILEIRDKLPQLKFVVMIKGSSQQKDVYSWNEVLRRASTFSEEDLEKRIKRQTPQDLATLVYTSGTTANPKAVMLSHDNLVFTAEAIVNQLKIGKDDAFLSYLPLSHIAEQMTTIHGPLNAGYDVAFAESLEKLPQNLQEIRPTVFLGVPRVWEKIQAKMVEKGAQASPLKKKIAKWAKSVGLRCGDDHEKQNALAYKVAKKLVYSKVRTALGLDRCRIQVTSAAPIGKETLEFFISLGIPLYEIFGMSECSGPATISYPGQYKLGKCGKSFDGGETKVAEDGEVLMRGRHVFMGYLHNEEATNETIDEEGWLHSGDLGELDGEGYLSITGRKKNLIITAGGENVAPEMLENKLKTIPEVEQAVVVGDRKKYLTALLTLNPEAVTMVGQHQTPINAKTVQELAQCEKFHKYIYGRIQELNGSVARVQTIKNFRILPQTFSEESGELTPTMKVKRNVVLKKFVNEIEAMY